MTSGQSMKDQAVHKQFRNQLIFLFYDIVYSLLAYGECGTGWVNVYSRGFTNLDGSVLTRSPFDPAAYDYHI